MRWSKRHRERLWLLVAFIILSYAASHYPVPQPVTHQDPAAHIVELYQQQRSDVQLEIGGTVIRLLPDDTDGSRHQRFIIELDNGHTLLVAHNIDLAPRIDALQIGDAVKLYGEYVWNDKGGVMHWTHHDPANRHPHGWIRHRDRLYQ